MKRSDESSPSLGPPLPNEGAKTPRSAPFQGDSSAASALARDVGPDSTQAPAADVALDPTLAPAPAPELAPDPAPELAHLRSVEWGALLGAEELVHLAAPALDEILAGTPAERVLDKLLRRHRASLSAPQRKLLAEALFGVSLWRRRLAHVAGGRTDARSLLSALVDLVPLADPGRAADAPLDRDPDLDLATRFSLPDWLLAQLQTELQALPRLASTSGHPQSPAPDAEQHLAALCTALNLPGPICLRANLLLTSRDALQATLAAEGLPTAPGRYAPTCLVVAPGHRPNIYGSPAHQAGLFEVQDEGSQLLALLVDAQPGDTVLDYCAGAGGKTLALAAQLQGRGALHVFDPEAERLVRLRQRAARARLAAPLQLHVHAQPPPPSLLADRVLVDAPCSELGTLRRGPDLRFRLDPRDFERLPPLQLDILERAARHVAPGGTLVYATCTWRREENEEVVRAFLQRQAQPGSPLRFSLTRPSATWLDPSFLVHAPSELCASSEPSPELYATPNGAPSAPPRQDAAPAFFKSFPHLHGTDGFFAAVFRRHPPA